MPIMRRGQNRVRRNFTLDAELDEKLRGLSEDGWNVSELIGDLAAAAVMLIRERGDARVSLRYNDVRNAIDVRRE